MTLSVTLYPFDFNSSYINPFITMIVSLVTPGSTKSSSNGVTISFSPVLVSLNTKKTFEVPTSPIFPSNK